MAYLVTAGFVPLLSELRSFGSVHANNPYHNIELAWSLMHVLPALVGIVAALWYLRHESLFSIATVVLLTLQSLFALLEYRREGFDSRLTTELSWISYAAAMLALATPFVAAYVLTIRKRSLSQ